MEEFSTNNETKLFKLENSLKSAYRTISRIFRSPNKTSNEIITTTLDALNELFQTQNLKQIPHQYVIEDLVQKQFEIISLHPLSDLSLHIILESIRRELFQIPYLSKSIEIQNTDSFVLSNIILVVQQLHNIPEEKDHEFIEMSKLVESQHHAILQMN